MTVTLADLERRLWDVANALRGPVGPADFKTHILRGCCLTRPTDASEKTIKLIGLDKFTAGLT